MADTPSLDLISITVHHIHEWRPGHADDPLAQLTERVNKIMSDLDNLNTELAGTQSDMDQIKAYIVSQNDKLTALQAQLTQLEQTTPPQVDLSGAIAAATNLKNESDAIVASFAPAPAANPTPASATEPTSSAPVTASSQPSSTDTSGSSAPASSEPAPSTAPASPAPADGSTTTDQTPA